MKNDYIEFTETFVPSLFLHNLRSMNKTRVAWAEGRIYIYMITKYEMADLEHVMGGDGEKQPVEIKNV